MDVTYAWRGEFGNDELNGLHAEGFGPPPSDDDWRRRVAVHSLGWVCARDGGGALIGFVNVSWDGATHAFILDTLVAVRERRLGIGRRLIQIAAEEARRGGCAWLHVDFEESLASFYVDACGFTPTPAGLIELWRIDQLRTNPEAASEPNERVRRDDDTRDPTIEDALSVAVEAHRGQLYPAPEPEPFILHPLRVMLGVRSRAARTVALLHDVVEDSPLALGDLAEKGFDQSVLDAVDSLSRRPGEAYVDYIDRVATNRLAREVKLADLADNLANNLALPPTSDNLDRIARYEDALLVLREASN